MDAARDDLGEWESNEPYDQQRVDTVAIIQHRILCRNPKMKFAKC